MDGAVSGETEETETGDEDGKQSKIEEHALEPVFGGIEFGEVFVDEGIFEGALGFHALPVLAEGGNSLLDMIRCDIYRDIMVEPGIEHAESEWLDGFLQRPVVEVFGDADDRAFIPPHFEFFSHGFFGIAIAEAPRGSLIEDKRMRGIRGELVGKSPAGSHLYAIVMEVLEIDYIEIEISALQDTAAVFDL